MTGVGRQRNSNSNNGDVARYGDRRRQRWADGG